jgi:hypothetical protein
MRTLLLLVFALVVLGTAVVMGAKTKTPPLCPIDLAFRSDTNCSCPVGYRFRGECTEPGLDHWQCVALKKELLYCTR